VGAPASADAATDDDDAACLPDIPFVSSCSALYVLAVLHKSMVLPLPAALIGIDIALLWRRDGRRQHRHAAPSTPADIAAFLRTCLWRKRALLTLAVLLVVPTVVSNHFDKAFGSHADATLLQRSQSLVLACVRLWAALFTFAVPSDLRPHYRVRPGDLTLPFQQTADTTMPPQVVTRAALLPACAVCTVSALCGGVPCHLIPSCRAVLCEAWRMAWGFF
jgi:hypothetical protein